MNLGPKRPRPSVSRALAGVVIALGLACASPPEPGVFGKLRVGGRVPGATPLNLLPPVSDRSGNVYVLYGGTTVAETIVFAARYGGGWTSGCKLTKGDAFGAHGWVGYSEDRYWYWSGDALVSVSGRTGDCHRVLDHDPATDANILFRAVLPAVRDAPSQRSLVAIVQSPIDLLPFSARVDLEAEILTNVNAFEPFDAREVKVLGVGADREAGEGVVLLQYKLGGGIRTEARFYDASAKLVATTNVALDAADTEYTVLGYLQASASGLYAGLLSSGSIVTFDKSGARATAVGQMAPIGVHRWDGDLYLVGTASGRPVIAKIGDDGGVRGVQIWDSSERAAENLRRPMDVSDDRSLPSTTTTFANPRTAMGEFPFLHAHALTAHATGTTLWLVAGPSFDQGGARITAFAMAPVGVAYP